MDFYIPLENWMNYWNYKLKLFEIKRYLYQDIRPQQVIRKHKVQMFLSLLYRKEFG